MKRYGWILALAMLVSLVYVIGSYVPTDEATEPSVTAESIQKDVAPQIAITFDDGPSIYTTELLEGLQERGVRATFFLIGECAQARPEVVSQIAKGGHLIGNHTYSHVDIARIPEREAREEIEKTNRILEKIIRDKVEYIRPPFGVWEKKLEDLNMMSVLWTVDPLDWTTKNADEIVNRVVTKTRENDIILMHDCYKSSVQAALRIIDLLQSEGYEFVTVDELFMN